jgi:hypothetical protein
LVLAVLAFFTAEVVCKTSAGTGVTSEEEALWNGGVTGATTAAQREGKGGLSDTKEEANERRGQGSSKKSYMYDSDLQQVEERG